MFLTQLNDDNREPSGFIEMDVMVVFFLTKLNGLVVQNKDLHRSI